MHSSIITSALLSLLLIAAPTLAHQDNPTSNVTIEIEIPTGAMTTPTGVPIDSAIAPNISTPYPEEVYPHASYSTEINQDVAPTYSKGLTADEEYEYHTNPPYLTVTEPSAATELPTITPDPATQPSSVATGAAYGYETEDLTPTETNMMSAVSPYPEATSVSLPVFTYDDGVQTSATVDVDSTYVTATLTNSTLPVSTPVPSTISAYTNRTTNTTTTSRTETLPPTVPNSAGSVTPFLSSIVGVLIVGFFAIGV